MTPSILSKSDSTHQKQPPANVALAVFAVGVGCACVAGMKASAVAMANQRMMLWNEVNDFMGCGLKVKAGYESGGA